MNRARFQKIRGNKSFQRALETIKNNRDMKIVTLTTISKTNYPDIELICKALSKHVHGFVFSLKPALEQRKAKVKNLEKELARVYWGSGQQIIGGQILRKMVKIPTVAGPS